MRLVALQVRHFGCVASAQVELGPGLNVLYGPNDLGKSSLAEAIRCALLLPAHSKESQRFESWHVDAAPEVVLTFESETSHYYRVSKTFSHRGGSAQLEFSRDGRSWTTEARGRDVDGELRRRLRWGIPEPGGRGSPRGLPDSFLTTALLAPQDDVAGVLQRSLDDDRELSGKERIAEALQALGEDAELVRVRNAVQARVDEAFTSTGRRRSGQGSPFAHMRDEVQAARRDLEEVREEVRESREVHLLVQELGDELLRARSVSSERSLALSEIEAQREHQAAYENAEAALQAAEGRVADIEAERAAMAELHVEERRAMADHYEIDKALAVKVRDREAAEAAVAEARQRLDMTLAETEGRVDSRRQSLTSQARELAAVEQAARQRMASARAAGDQTRQVMELEARLEETRRHLQALDAAGDDRVEALRAERELLDGLVLWLALETAKAELGRATLARAEADHQLEEATRLKAEAREIERQLAERPVPDPALIKNLRELREKLRLAEARLDVGLTVTVEPRQPFALEVTRDGEPGPTQLQSEPIRLEARRRLELSLGALAAVTIEGGDPEAREAAGTLRGRWQRSALPRFEEAGVDSLESLEARAQQAVDATQRAQDLRRDAAHALEKAGALDDVEAAVTRTRQRVRDAESDLAGLDRPLLEERAATLGSDPDAELVRRRRQLEIDLREAESATQAGLVERAGVEARLEALGEQVAAARSERDRRQGEIEGDWNALLQAAAVEADEAAEARESVEKELAALEDTESDAAAEAREAFERAEQALAEARDSESTARDERDDAQRLVATLQGQLEERHRRGELLDLEGARGAVDEARAALAAAPPPATRVTEESLAEAREALRQAEAEIRDLESRRDRAHGALAQVGGSDAEERLADAEEAFNLALQRERDLEADYDAWQLLVGVITEVEREEANHLGRTLVGPVMEHFRELTGGRYGGLSLGTGLSTESILAGGDERDPFELSVGTREQLATVIRVALARQLESVVVLDDQLVQSDRHRANTMSRWLRRAGIQVVVLTARPLDYLEPAEMPAEQEGWVLEINGVRAVDLARVIKRG